MLDQAHISRACKLTASPTMQSWTYGSPDMNRATVFEAVQYSTIYEKLMSSRCNQLSL